MQREVMVVSGVRTAIGDFGGGLKDVAFARVAAMGAGVAKETPALTLNRLCGSGLQAIVSAAQTIMLGDTDIAVAGGAECMSRSQYWLPNMRWGQRMNDAAVLD